MNIKHSLLPHTTDIWARDYMPIQVKPHKLISFTYNPDYLQSPEWQSSRTNPTLVLSALKLDYMKSPIIIDGGNVACCLDKVILTDKVFTENKQYEKKQLQSQLEQLFATDKIFFIPKQPYDYQGHVDGMLRFLNEETLLVNNYSRESKSFFLKN